MKKTNLYIVSGGVGKQVLFTNLIEDLAKKDNNLISIAAPCVELFSHHPLVHSVIDFTKIEFNYDTLINSQLLDKYFNDIILFDPYQSNLLKCKEHILDAWRKGLHLPGTNNTLTDVKVDNNDNEYGSNSSYNDIVQHIQTTEYIIVQLKGYFRQYHDEYQLLTTLSNNFNNHHFVVVRLKEDIYDDRLLDVPNISFLENVPLPELQFVINNCLAFIGVDSCIQHFAANKEYCKKGIVMWGNCVGPQPHTIGHQHNTNLMSEKIEQVYISDETIIKEFSLLLNTI